MANYQEYATYGRNLQGQGGLSSCITTTAGARGWGGVGWRGVAWGSAARVSPERREGVGERRGEEVGAHSLLLHLILISTEGIPKLQRLLISAFNSGLNKFSSKADQNLALQL